MRYFYYLSVLLIVLTVFIEPSQAQTTSARGWSGFYAGGSVGVTVGIADTQATTAYIDKSTWPGGVQVAAAGEGTLSQWRMSGNMYGGFGKQLGSMFVGVEASVNSLFIL